MSGGFTVGNRDPFYVKGRKKKKEDLVYTVVGVSCVSLTFGRCLSLKEYEYQWPKTTGLWSHGTLRPLKGRGGPVSQLSFILVVFSGVERDTGNGQSRDEEGIE